MSECSAVKSHVNPMTALACGVRGMGGARSCATDSPSRGGIVIETSGRYSEIAFQRERCLFFDRINRIYTMLWDTPYPWFMRFSGNEITLWKSFSQIKTE